MKIDARSREEYFSKAGDREGELRELDAFIRASAPDLPPTLSGGITGKMLGYGDQKYRPKAGKEEIDWPVLMLAAQKNHISLYACAVIDGEYIAEKYEKQLGKVSTGKSCIRFKKVSDLDKAGLKQMLVDINRRVKAGEKLYGQ